MNYTKGEITDRALTILRLRGCKVWRQNNVRAVKGRNFVGLKGISDLAGFHEHTGLAVYCEIKTITDKFSKEQVDFLTDVKLAGAWALIATQEGTEIVIKDFDPSEMIAGKIIKSILNKRA